MRGLQAHCQIAARDFVSAYLNFHTFAAIRTPDLTTLLAEPRDNYCARSAAASVSGVRSRARQSARPDRPACAN